MAQGHNKNINESSNRRKNKLRIVTVLSIRDGDSLGAYGCGVYKTLSKYGVNFNIVSDSSIGSNDASIVAGTRTENPVQTRSNAFKPVCLKRLSLGRFSTTRGFFPNRLGNDAGGSLGMFYKQKMKLAIFVMKASNIFIVTRFSKKLCNMNGTINSPLKVVISFYR